MDMREKDRLGIEAAGSPGGPAASELLAAVPSPNGDVSPSSPGLKSAAGTVPKTLLETPHPYPGRLICVEGIDGSGKSTQLLLLERWLRSEERRVGKEGRSR